MNSTVWQAEMVARHRSRETQFLVRSRRNMGSVQQPFIECDGGWVTNFSSNDYLGLSSHPKLIEAVADHAQHWGVGAGASHLVCGHQTLHHLFEEELADFVGAERALLFSTGYMANLAINVASLNRGDLTLHDRLNHASLIDGAQLSAAQFKRYQHVNVEHAEQRILSTAHNKLQLVSDGVFSMDGDIAPVTDLQALSIKYHGLLFIDDAHGFGVLGKGGRGTLSHFDKKVTGDILMVGTLGKALGCFGAFVAGDACFIEELIQSARSYIYTTALPPTVVAAGRAALAQLKSDYFSLNSQLQANIEHFKDAAQQLGLPLLPSITPIQPILIGAEKDAVAMSEQLSESGFLVPAIRTPTVAKGQARLRVALSAAHTPYQIDAVLDALFAAYQNCQQDCCA